VSELPKGWVLTKFGNVLLSLNSGLNGKQNKTGEGIPVSRIETIANQRIDMTRIGFLKDYDEEKIEKYRLHEGNILFSNINSPAHLGKTALCEKGIELYHGVNLLRLTVNEGIIPSLLNYYCKYIRGLGEFSAKAQHAVNQSSLNQTKLKDFDIPIAPLNEQIRIADKLDSMLAKVDIAQARLDKIPNILKRFRQSVLAAATSGELTKEWRGDSVERVITDKYSAPKSWDLFIFEKLIDVVTSGSRGWAKYYSDQGSTFIRAQNINSDSLNLSDIAYVSLPEKAEGRRTKVEKDNLLITITGANVTKAARVSEKLPDAYVSQHVALVKLKNNDLSPFLELFIKANNSGRGQLLELAYGGGKPGLNLQNIKGLKVALPSIEEQKEIIRRVESLFNMADTVEKQYKDAKARTNRLTQSILAKAFRGELVPQDPNDEPASKLLTRIKVEQAKLKPAQTRKRKVVQ